jgi:hypothetical protein
MGRRKQQAHHYAALRMTSHLERDDFARKIKSQRLPRQAGPARRTIPWVIDEKYPKQNTSWAILSNLQQSIRDSP